MQHGGIKALQLLEPLPRVDAGLGDELSDAGKPFPVDDNGLSHMAQRPDQPSIGGAPQREQVVGRSKKVHLDDGILGALDGLPAQLGLLQVDQRYANAAGGIISVD